MDEFQRTVLDLARFGPTNRTPTAGEHAAVRAIIVEMLKAARADGRAAAVVLADRALAILDGRSDVLEIDGGE